MAHAGRQARAGGGGATAGDAQHKALRQSDVCERLPPLLAEGLRRITSTAGTNTTSKAQGGDFSPRELCCDRIWLLAEVVERLGG